MSSMIRASTALYRIFGVPRVNAIAEAILRNHVLANLTPLIAVIKKHTWILPWIGGSASIVSVLACAAPLLLPVIGFGAAGIVPGSLAAFLQATAYGSGIPHGSLFALCQSFGMGGAAGVHAVTIYQTISGTTAAITGGVGMSSFFKWA
ncbi:hypothetical protein DACRYDRAFT_112570 [Dacryopinax primogenitus]|uniref:Uncharacterized protein n=1 Tax=Dacryopinax primogenitus (strain DJM 731) TaxID=1858805 RepID=M5FYN7_DACPD|nr:uncharacterized protein DACRYDRAFT_112570 [Dacryopinax primogenitus]EJT96622.1 hypothetical protein DACRYDRAFT_112570 [Dacryopinax primogenitus]